VLEQAGLRHFFCTHRRLQRLSHGTGEWSLNSAKTAIARPGPGIGEATKALHNLAIKAAANKFDHSLCNKALTVRKRGKDSGQVSLACERERQNR
jgi:hypothetical protein